VARILITGTSGFIGSQLAQLAAREGNQVTAVSAVNNNVEKARVDRLAAAGIAVAVASLEDRVALAKALAGQDAVIHLAAAQHEAEASEDHFRRVNVEGTRTLLELSIESGVRRFVHGSTIGVYGSTVAPVLDESSPLAPENPYGRTKAEAEVLVRQYLPKIPLCIARISETYGPGDMRLLKLFRGINKGRFVTIGNGRNLHQLIYVDDLARGLLAATEAPDAVGATFILAGAQSVTTDDMVAAIAAAVGKQGSIPHVPLWPFDVAAVMMEKTLVPLGIRPPLHRRRLDFFRKSFNFSTAQAQRVLGVMPQVSFAEGASRTAQWYRDTGMLT
jgi:nucleoside-diphosphate-sugar epimerase